MNTRTSAGGSTSRQPSMPPNWTSVSLNISLPSLIDFFATGPPKNMYAVPSKPSYNVGDVLTCNADANPTAIFSWQNLRTGQIVSSDQNFEIDSTYEGWTTAMRCVAQNSILGVVYNTNLIINITVGGWLFDLFLFLLHIYNAIRYYFVKFTFWRNVGILWIPNRNTICVNNMQKFNRESVPIWCNFFKLNSMH